MPKQSINVGATANDKKGDSLRAAFQKVNANFTELYTQLGLTDDDTLNLGAFEFAGSVMSTTDSTAVVIDQAVTVASNLTVGGDVIPSVANGGDLGSAAKPWRSLHVSGNTLFIGGTAVAVNGNGQLTVDGSTVVGPQGAAGATGATGAAGAVGATGAVGAVGATGAAAGPNISSEGDVSIEINLSDSTLRRWSFGEDGVLNLAGNLQFADGTNQSTALRTSQDESSVAIGGSGTDQAGGLSPQSGQAIAIGSRAARTAQGGQAVAIGSHAGDTSQGIGAVAIGTFAGAGNQITNAIAIGTFAGQTNQGSGAIAIGRNAGFTGQAIRSIAIGDSAGKTNQHEGTIVFNSTGSPLETEGTGRLYIKSLRGVVGASLPAGFKPVAYNSTTAEFIYYDL